jgi:hypothetical protein
MQSVWAQHLTLAGLFILMSSLQGSDHVHTALSGAVSGMFASTLLQVVLNLSVEFF